MATTQGQYHLPTATTSAFSAAAVTPGTPYAGGAVAKGLYVGVTGNVNVTMQDGSVALFVAVPAGVILPIFHVLVQSGSTTAGSMIALF